MPAFTEEQVVNFAPDENSIVAGRQLAYAANWVSFGANESALWGECKGSGSKPYQACIDIAGAAFKCSCPSRKIPCKHCLALLYLNIKDSAAFSITEPPSWVADWLHSREERAEKKSKKAEDAAPVDPVAKAKRQASRNSKVESGLNDFSLWLQDRIRQGFSGLDAQSYQFWEKQAARLTDAQAPGLARLLRQCAGIPNSGEGWQSRLIEQLSLMHTIVEGFQNLKDLPENVQQDIRSAVGFNVSQDEVLSSPALKDIWHVLGQRVDAEDKLRTQRTWLRGERTGRWALILSFAHGTAPLDNSFSAGFSYDAELCFFPGSYPVRALMKSKTDTKNGIKSLRGYASAERFLEDYALALACNPFLETLPVSIENVRAIPSETGFVVVDSESKLIPLTRSSENLKWHVLALSGAYPFEIFGEWTGSRLRLLSCVCDEVFYRLDPKAVAYVP